MANGRGVTIRGTGVWSKYCWRLRCYLLEIPQQLEDLTARLPDRLIIMSTSSGLTNSVVLIFSSLHRSTCSIRRELGSYDWTQRYSYKLTASPPYQQYASFQWAKASREFDHIFLMELINCISAIHDKGVPLDE